MSSQSSPLLKPLFFHFSQRTAQNRLLKAAMTERLASWDPRLPNKRGIPSPELINLYRRWGEGGYGLILTDNIMIDPINLEAPGNLVIPTDPADLPRRTQAWSQLAREARKNGSLIIGPVVPPRETS
ncbi:hypothetical protein PHISCL_05173 [Aspergillus sclerotialis]|uniref:NADH:flavin oxidoreductase/NADH oxidase N-terminal domain-containing protein n=1 Tax=Aspergillus sclerotialis TaxID=2070753 RepID=A0A3A2ZM72_9EURO|nr:hypothetical protein PHISCL_05173 [Aspergillus sclerotialis]